MSRNKGGENGGTRIRQKARSPLLEHAGVLAEQHELVAFEEIVGAKP